MCMPSSCSGRREANCARWCCRLLSVCSHCVLLCEFTSFSSGKNMSVSSHPQLKNQTRAMVLTRVTRRGRWELQTDIDCFAWT